MLRGYYFKVAIFQKTACPHDENKKLIRLCYEKARKKAPEILLILLIFLNIDTFYISVLHIKMR